MHHDASHAASLPFSCPPPLLVLPSPPFVARAHPAPRVGALGAQDDHGQLDGDAERERDLEGRLPDQHDAQPDEHGARRVARGGGGAADAHGRHDVGSHSRCVCALFSPSFVRARWLKNYNFVVWVGC